VQPHNVRAIRQSCACAERRLQEELKGTGINSEELEEARLLANGYDFIAETGQGLNRFYLRRT
jgi:hypothetical protein